MGDLFKVFPLSDEKIGNLKRVIMGLGAVAGGSALPGLGAVIASGKLLEALPKLISSGHLPNGLLESGFDVSKLGGEDGPLKRFLSWTGKSSLEDAIDWINSQPPDACGATTLADPPAGSLPPLSGGRQPIMFYVQEIDGKMPVPKIKMSATDPTLLDQDQIRTVLVNALNFWALKMNMDPSSTENEGNANLLISGRTGGFGPNVVALGDIGPVHTKKCRLIFNLAETLTIPEFMYTVAHEFGHCLGVSHADVPRTGALMSPVMDIGDGTAIQPREVDFAAAERKGWKRS